MLLRFLAIMMCLVWSIAEFQCPGPGRFSMSPGICTNQYYTCNRDANREYTAYVLNCPGNAIFNDRSRRCSNPRNVQCSPATTAAANVTQTGAKSSMKTSASRRPPVRTTTSPAFFISSKRTTERKSPVIRKANRPSRATAKPYRNRKSTPPMKTKVEQWRIRQPMPKKRATTAWTNTLTWPATFSNSFRRSTTSLTNVTTNMFFQETSTASVFNSIQATQPTTTGANSSKTTQPICNTSTHFLSPFLPINNVSKLAMSNQSVTQQSEAKPIMHNTTTETVTTTSYAQPPLQTISKLVTHSTKVSSFNSGYFDTTPETMLKGNEKPIPFIDSLEGKQDSDDMKIVYVAEDPQSISDTKVKLQEKKIHDQDTVKNQIRYFYDPDINYIPLHKRLPPPAAENNSKFHNVVAVDYKPKKVDAFNSNLPLRRSSSHKPLRRQPKILTDPV